MEKINSVDFPFADLDPSNTNQDGISVASESLEKLLQWIWKSEDLKFAFIRFISMSAAMHPELLNDQTYQELAKKLNCTRSLISRNVVDFQDTFGVHFRRSKKESSRKSYQAASFKNQKRGNHKFLKKFKFV